MAYDIFISYRRNGGYETAKHLYDLMVRDGYRVSFDIDTLRSGDFDKELLRRIDECRDFIVILNPGVFDRCFDSSLRSEEDWLRTELAYALKRKKNVIPIMLAGFTEFPDHLPADIAHVARKNGPKYDRYYFDDFYRRLKSSFLDTEAPKTVSSEDDRAGQLRMRIVELKSLPERTDAVRLELAEAYYQLGNLSSSSESYDAAEYWKEALAIYEELEAADPPAYRKRVLELKSLLGRQRRKLLLFLGVGLPLVLCFLCIPVGLIYWAIRMGRERDYVLMAVFLLLFLLYLGLMYLANRRKR